MLLKVLSNALHFFCCCLVSFLVSLLPPTPFVLRPATGESGDPSGVATHTHEKLVCVLRDELLLDLVLVIAQDIDARENKALNPNHKGRGVSRYDLRTTDCTTIAEHGISVPWLNRGAFPLGR